MKMLYSWVCVCVCVCICLLIFSLCLQVNVASLENVVRFYLNLAEEKTEAARQESHQAVVDIDDLDNVATPESILLRYSFCWQHSNVFSS